MVKVDLEDVEARFGLYDIPLRDTPRSLWQGREITKGGVHSPLTDLCQTEFGAWDSAYKAHPLQQTVSKYSPSNFQPKPLPPLNPNFSPKGSSTSALKPPFLEPSRHSAPKKENFPLLPSIQNSPKKPSLPTLDWAKSKLPQQPSFKTKLPSAPYKANLPPKKNTSNLPLSPPIQNSSKKSHLQNLDWAKSKLPQQPSFQTKLPLAPYKANPSLPPERARNITNTPPVVLHPSKQVSETSFSPQFSPSSHISGTQAIVDLEFSAGLAVGVAKGGWASAGGYYNFAKELVYRPAEIVAGTIQGLVELKNLVVSKEWDHLSKALAPECRELVLQ